MVAARKPKQDKLPAAIYYERSDMGNARRMVDMYRSKLRFVHGPNRWLIWDSTRWKPDEKGGIMRCAKECVKNMWRAAGEPTDPFFDKNLAKWAISCQNMSRLAAMIEVAKSEPDFAIKQDDLDSDPWLLNCKNGTIDLHTGKLRKHDPVDLITKRIEVNFDPGAKCPRWTLFMETISGADDELSTFIQRCVGYSITGAIVEHVLLFMYGHGSNGKSTFIETITELLSEYACQIPTESLTVHDRSSVPADIAMLAGARIVATNETESDQRMAESTVKALTGGDKITARFMRQNFFTFKPSHKLWMMGNHKLTIRGTDNGIWRRVRLIPFEIRIPDEYKDHHLKAKLQKEFPGILAWAVRGCLLWQRDGLGSCAAVDAATAEYRTEMDFVQDWIDTCLVFNPETWVLTHDLFKSYENYCEDTGERAISERRLNVLLKERGFKLGKTPNSTKRAWRGVRTGQIGGPIL